MNKDNFMKLCGDYKGLILEVVNRQFMTPAQFSKSLWGKNYKEVECDFKEVKCDFKEVKCDSKEVKCDSKVEVKKVIYLERIRSMDEDCSDALNKLQNSGQRFCGYDKGGGHLVKTDWDVLNWIDSIKQAKRLRHGLDITNAILQKMEEQEQVAGLTLVFWAGQESVKFEGKTFVLDKEEYVTKEIYTMMGVVPSTFSGYKSMPGFPEPIDSDNIPHKYTREATIEIFSFVKDKRANSNKTLPNRRKRKKTTKKHRRT